LTAEASAVEQQANVSPAESREAIKSAIEQRYTSAA
jgi:hypothetical protein